MIGAPKFIDIDGKRYLWRDIVKLRQEQCRAAAWPRARSRRCSNCARISARSPNARQRPVISNRHCFTFDA